MALSIDITDLEHDFGESFALSIRELRIAPGEHVAFIGPSGSGKSTLLHLIAGILSPKRGRIELGGIDWSQLSESARRARRIREIGLVFQEFELLEHLSVFENVLLPFFVSNALARNTAADARAKSLLEAAGLGVHFARKPRQLSHGERQRVALCRALVASPSIVLADEPTGNLDPDNAKRALALLLDECRRAQATLVLVTHDHSLLSAFDRVVDFRSFHATRTHGAQR